ncbi:MAG: UDP-N-acetylmuramate--L-alanine ligase [Elusimicrobia bacterium]|nr:UDP-N-acetylmuramate--L-alanine ligase [Elusimicrobiota bacterium]
MFKKIQHIHFVGIGGSGMSGIAEVLCNLGYKVSGSDLKKTDVTDHLKKCGAAIFIGHAAKNICSAQVVVTSTAVSKTNPEVRAAEKRKIPVIPRIEMLAEIARLKYAVTIAGTHGKTTTTSLAALVLERGGLDPTIVVGGRLKNIKSGAKLGKGDYLVAEADESDGSFLKLSPTITVVTNIDNDHLDYYGTIDNIKQAFVQHINSVPFYGCAIVCTDDANIREILPLVKRRILSYGFSGKPDITARGIRAVKGGVEFTVCVQGKKQGKVVLRVPGRHNILNSLAAVAVGLELGIPFSVIARALNSYAGVGRRLEVKGEKNGITVIDDYGHHPTEIKATLAAVKSGWPRRRIVVVFQPHRYSRTAHLHKEFGASFQDADIVVLQAIYPAGEQPIPGVSSKLVYESVKNCGGTVSFFADTEVLARELRPRDVVITLGAGDVWKTGEELLTLI